MWNPKAESFKQLRLAACVPFNISRDCSIKNDKQETVDVRVFNLCLPKQALHSASDADTLHGGSTDHGRVSWGPVCVFGDEFALGHIDADATFVTETEAASASAAAAASEVDVSVSQARSAFRDHRDKLLSSRSRELKGLVSSDEPMFWGEVVADGDRRLRVSRKRGRA